MFALTGLIVCRRGSASWSAFVEAKSGGSPIRADQIQAYAELAKDMNVDTIITISNEFASTPDELPYHLGFSQAEERADDTSFLLGGNTDVHPAIHRTEFKNRRD